jgi:peroxiredoxin
MNERIKQLADEAFVTVSSDGYFSSGKFCEKFAELIVRECAQVGFEAVSNGDLVEDSILTHFGVEE